MLLVPFNEAKAIEQRLKDENDRNRKQDDETRKLQEESETQRKAVEKQLREINRAEERLQSDACATVFLGYRPGEGVAFYNEVTVDKSAAGCRSRRSKRKSQRFQRDAGTSRQVIAGSTPW